MNWWTVGIILISVAVYIAAIIIFIQRREKDKEFETLIDIKKQESIKTFHYEDVFLLKFKIKPEKVRIALYLERFLIIAGSISLFIGLRGLALALIGAIVVVFIADDSYKKVIYNSGMTTINKVTNFINYFVPHINSGNSADQSFLGYIEYSQDQDLIEYYENRDNPEYKMPRHIKQIVDIYDIAKYNEEEGISDYTYILNELSEDMAQKQVYYNNFISRIGEIKPIMWSYYIGVPILIMVSFSQTYEFWMQGGGYVVALILLGFFSLFKFLIYKLQKKTVNTIF